MVEQFGTCGHVDNRARGLAKGYARRVRNLRLPGALISIGFVGVLVWTIAFLIPAPYANEAWVYDIATTAGYGLAGFATWRWIVGNWKAGGDGFLVRGPSRWMAAASVVTAAGVAALTYLTHRVHGGPYYRLHLAGNAVGTLDFLLAALGFGSRRVPVPLNKSNPHFSEEGNTPETESLSLATA